MYSCVARLRELGVVCDAHVYHQSLVLGAVCSANRDPGAPLQGKFVGVDHDAGKEGDGLDEPGTEKSTTFLFAHSLLAS